jgi:hypothetical protein
MQPRQIPGKTASIHYSQGLSPGKTLPGGWSLCRRERLLCGNVPWAPRPEECSRSPLQIWRQILASG